MNRLKFNFTLLLSLFFLFQINAQTVNLTGYTFEEDNRGYLNEVKITVLKMPEKIIAVEAVSNLDGEFMVQIPAGVYLVRAEKDIFKVLEMELNTVGKTAGEKVFLKMEMQRKPGYLFDATLAEKRTDENQVVDAIQGSLIEIYNNTTEKSEKVLENHPTPYFSHTFEQGNHYTIMIRKEGYLAKRIEAYINVKGCIICVDGVKKLGPGITDNLTHGFEMGTLLANIELDKADLDSKIALENIYYDLNKWDIRPEAAKELDKVVVLMRDNPEIIVELGSHTDSRGGDKFNLDLSQKRAKSAVKYITGTGKINTNRIKFKGYGETQLVNKCKNGVKCSERRHQLNRRSELKIIGFKAKRNPRSLEEMIRSEKFDKEMEAIDNQEVVRISADGKAVKESQPELKIQKDVEVKSEVKKTETVVSTPKKNTAPTQIQNQSSVELEDPIISMAIDSVRAYAGKKTVTEKVEEQVVFTEKSVPAPKKEVIVQENTAVNIQQQQQAISAPVRRGDSVVEEAKRELERLKANEKTDEISVVIQETKLEERAGQKGDLIISGNSNSQKIASKNDTIVSTGQVAEIEFDRSIKADYTGYKIEVLRSSNLLPQNHEVFSEYGGVYIEKLKTGDYAYLLGDFKVKRIAMYYLNNTVFDKYPDGKLVLFADGKRR